MILLKPLGSLINFSSGISFEIIQNAISKCFDDSLSEFLIFKNSNSYQSGQWFQIATLNRHSSALNPFIILDTSDTTDLLFFLFSKYFLAWVPWQHVLLICLSLHWLFTCFYARSLDARISENLALRVLCFSPSAIFLRDVFKAMALNSIHRHLISNLLYSSVTSSNSRYLHPRAQFDIPPWIPKSTSKGWKQILHFPFKHVFQLVVSILGNGFTIYPISSVPNLVIILSLPFLCPHPLTN